MSELRTFLVIPGPTVCWGIDAAKVQRIVDEREDFGGEAIDLFTTFGTPADLAATPRRVLAVQAPGCELGVRAAGAIAVRSVDAAKVCPLPRMVRRGRLGTALEGVVFAESGPPLLVLDCAGLAGGAQP